MRVKVNGEFVDIETPATVADLVRQQTGRENPLGVAVARNREVVPRSAWADIELTDADEIELVGVMQGG